MKTLISILIFVFACQAMGYEIQGTVRKHDPSNPYAPEIVEVTAEELWSLDSTVRISQGSKFVGTGTLVVRPDVVLTKYHTLSASAKPMKPMCSGALLFAVSMAVFM
ncbi:MAG: hypothetical protein R2827_14000 [Bdellovibrionales bacterium]